MAQQVVPWVLIRLDQSVLAVESSSVREMLLLPRVTVMPNASAEIRGVVTLRNRAIPVIDLRKMLGMPSLAEDSAKLTALLAQRAEEHRRWLCELEASVNEGRKFTLTLDPHECAFGRWFDNFKATSVVLESHLKRFNHPHKEIHALGRTVEDLVKAGNVAEAQALIQQAQSGVLVTLMQLFEETPKVLAEMNREMVIVLRDDRTIVSVTADAVESVEAIRADTLLEIQLPNGARAAGPVTHTARTAKTDRLVLILDDKHLLREFSHIEAPMAEAEEPASVAA